MAMRFLVRWYEIDAINNVTEKVNEIYRLNLSPKTKEAKPVSHLITQLYQRSLGTLQTCLCYQIIKNIQELTISSMYKKPYNNSNNYLTKLMIKWSDQGKIFEYETLGNYMITCTQCPWLPTI